MKLETKVALVTGSVRGLGWEIVQAYADEGAKITICDLVAAEVEQAVARLRIAENRVLGVKADVTRELDVTELFERLRGNSASSISLSTTPDLRGRVADR